MGSEEKDKTEMSIENKRFFEQLFDSKLDSFKRELLENQETSNLKLAKRLKTSEGPEFKKKGNKIQYNFNNSIKDKISAAIEDVETVCDRLNEGSPEEDLLRKAKAELAEGNIELEQRNKLIVIADQSEAGWAVVEEYQSNIVADDEEDDKKIRRAEMAAIRKQKAKKEKKYGQYGRGRPYFNRSDKFFPGRRDGSGGFSPYIPRRRAPAPDDMCYACGGLGHWANGCPRRQAYNAPSQSTPAK